MIRRILPAATLALAAALAGCSSGSEPAAEPSATTAAPTSAAPTTPGPISDEPTIRQICNHVADLGSAPNFHAAPNLEAGQRAARITDPSIANAGEKLMRAAGGASAAPGPASNVELAQAQIDVAQACADKYGDGPW